jgi:glycosyltransferase
LKTKVSIITVSLNSEEKIVECVNSVQNQTYSSIEHIIIDGVSTDNTLKIIHSVSNRISQIISEPDSGIYEALNKGINIAAGDIIGILHTDDLFATNDIIQKIVRFFETTNADGIYGDLNYVGRINPHKIIRYWKSCPYIAPLLQKGWMPPHPTLFVKKDVFLKHGMYNLNYKISADYDFILRIFQDTELHFAYLPEVITQMRVGGMSNNSIKNIIQKSKEDLESLKKNKVKFPLLVLLRKNFSKVPQFIPTTK